MVEVILPSLVDLYKKLDHQIYYLIYIYTLTIYQIEWTCKPNLQGIPWGSLICLNSMQCWFWERVLVWWVWMLFMPFRGVTHVQDRSMHPPNLYEISCNSGISKRKTKHASFSNTKVSLRRRIQNVPFLGWGQDIKVHLNSYVLPKELGIKVEWTTAELLIALAIHASGC